MAIFNSKLLVYERVWLMVMNDDYNGDHGDCTGL